MAAGTLGAPPPGTKARRTHDRLLEAMERLLARGGYPAATSTQVAAEAGVSSGTFYTYFPDREAALAALFARRLHELVTAVAEVLTLEALLDDGLRAVLARAVDVVLRHYRGHAPAFRAALVQLPSSPAIRDVYWAAHERSEELLVSFVRRAQAAGRVRAGDPVIMARTLLVVIQGANNPLLLTDPRSRRTRAIERHLVDLLVALLAEDR